MGEFVKFREVTEDRRTTSLTAAEEHHTGVKDTSRDAFRVDADGKEFQPGREKMKFRRGRRTEVDKAQHHSQDAYVSAQRSARGRVRGGAWREWVEQGRGYGCVWVWHGRGLLPDQHRWKSFTSQRKSACNSLLALD